LDALLTERKATHVVPRLWFFFLGDIIDGSAIFPSHASELDLTVIDQVLEGAQVFAGFLSHFSAQVQDIRVECVVGNHGRLSKEAAVGDNWELLLYKFMQKQLESHTNIQVGVDRAYFRTPSVRGHRFLLLHGHQLKSTNNTSLERFVGRYQSFLGGDLDYICMGHWHSLKHTRINGTELIMNPAFCAPSNYQIGKLGYGGRPAQFVFGVTDDGLTWGRELPVT